MAHKRSKSSPKAAIRLVGFTQLLGVRTHSFISLPGYKVVFTSSQTATISTFKEEPVTGFANICSVRGTEHLKGLYMQVRWTFPVQVGQNQLQCPEFKVKL